MPPILHARELSRWYGMVMGLNNVTFDIEPGLTGLVGPNGAGKSTLIQIITGQLQPSSGCLTVFGETPWNNPRLLQRIGYVPEREAVHKELRPLDWLRGLALLSGLAPGPAGERSVAALEKVKLPREHWGKRMSHYSKGMKQRAKLAQALLHEPDLLVLDEPMNGLDPMGRQEVAQILAELAASGTSILISSHILAELESLCKSILILNWGRVLASGSQKEIRSDLKNWSEQLSIRCDDPQKLALPLYCLAVCGAMIRDELQADTLAFLTTRPVGRAQLFLIKYGCQMIWLQAMVGVHGVLLFGVGWMRGVPGVESVWAPFFAAQIPAVLAWGALCAFLGLITRRYLVLGIVYGFVVELGLGHIPTNINSLSLTRHLQGLLGQNQFLNELYEWPEAGVWFSLGMLLVAVVVFLGAGTALFTFREYHHATEMQK